MRSNMSDNSPPVTNSLNSFAATAFLFCLCTSQALYNGISARNKAFCTSEFLYMNYLSRAKWAKYHSKLQNSNPSAQEILGNFLEIERHLGTRMLKTRFQSNFILFPTPGKANYVKSPWYAWHPSPGANH